MLQSDIVQYIQKITEFAVYGVYHKVRLICPKMMQQNQSGKEYSFIWMGFVQYNGSMVRTNRQDQFQEVGNTSGELFNTKRACANRSNIPEPYPLQDRFFMKAYLFSFQLFYNIFIAAIGIYFRYSYIMLIDYRYVDRITNRVVL